MATQLQRFRGSGARQGRGLLAFTPNMDAFHAPIVTPPPTGDGTVLPDWPVDYTGNTYYVSTAEPAGNALSTNRSNAGDAAFALANAPSLSTIVFLGAGAYPGLTVNRTQSTHLKLVADVQVFDDLRNLHPTSMTAAQLGPNDGDSNTVGALASNVVVNPRLTTSTRLGALTIQDGGYIWVEGFRSEYPVRWVVAQSAGSSAAACQGVWFERCRRWQGGGANLQIGPMNSTTVNKLNVVHKCWMVSEHENGDAKEGGGTWEGIDSTNPAGSAVTDYGITVHQNTGAFMCLDSFFQMRANHMCSTKRGVGLNTRSVRCRIEGNLFASWNRTNYARTSTAVELGQECDEGSTEYTSWAMDVLNNTFADPNGRVLYIKNANDVNFSDNRVIMMAAFLVASLESGYTDRNTVQATGVIPGPVLIKDNIFMERTGTNHLYSTGAACQYTFENNDTLAAEPITTHAAFINPDHIAPGQASPRPTVVRTGGNASGFAAPTSA